MIIKKFSNFFLNYAPSICTFSRLRNRIRQNVFEKSSWNTLFRADYDFRPYIISFLRAWRRCIQRAHNSQKFSKTFLTIHYRKNNNSNKIYTYTLCSMIASNKNVTVITSIALNKTLTGFQMIECSLAPLDMSHHEIIRYSFKGYSMIFRFLVPPLARGQRLFDVDIISQMGKLESSV